MRAILAALAMVAGLAAAHPAGADVAAGLYAYRTGDYDKARRELWRPAALEGDAEAAYTLGVMHRDGKGVVQDDAEAMKWLRIAAALGEGRAMLALGRAYERGEGARADRIKAMAWYRLAADRLSVGLNRDAALRGHHRIASIDGTWAERQADKLADKWRADLPTAAMVLSIQDGLASFGYPVGPVDGIVGPKTRGAIRSYQKRNGLTVDGQATGALQDHIVAQRLAMPN
jgi:TPR repeat protein